MKQFEYEYRVVRPGCNYPTYTEFFEQDVYMCSYAEPLSYYADHFVYNGEDPLNNQCLTLVGWGVHCARPALILVLWDDQAQRTYLMGSEGVVEIEYLSRGR